MREELIGSPVVSGPLVGRLEEVAEVVRLLASSRLLTITGAGGGGKTRLALAVAERWAAAHPGARVRWVGLATIEAPELLPEHVARTLAGERSAEHPDGTVLDPSGVLGPLGSVDIGPTDLLILDNCEHLVGAVVELVDAWLTARPSLRLLTTSRVPLALPTERRWPLPPLRVPTEEETDPASYDAVQLFVDRAQVVSPDLRLGRAEAAAIASICRRLDGNALAIELCAARLQVLGLSQLSAGLGDVGRLLSGRNRCLPPRQRTLWDTLDWSHRLLDDAEANVFAALGAFAGPADLEAVEAVAGGDCLDALTGLLEHSLVRATLIRAGVDLNGDDVRRFELADPVRQYARRRLEISGRAAAVRDAHLRWFAEQAALAFAGSGRAEQSARYHGLQASLPELRASLAWARARGRTATELKLAADLAPFAIATGLHREGLVWLEQALADLDAPRTGDPRAAASPAEKLVDAGLVARARRAAGTLAFLQCAYDRAASHLHAAEAEYGALGDESGRAHCLQSLASIARERGDYRSAIDILDRAQGAWLSVGDQPVAELAGIGLAFTVLLDGSPDRAGELAEQALLAAHARQDPGAVADCLLVLGGAALATGDLELAGEHLSDALTRSERDGLAEVRAYALEWLGVVARERGEQDRSAELLSEALRRQFELGDLWRTASVLINVAGCQRDRGRPDSAARALGVSAGLLARIGAALPPVDRRFRDVLTEDLVGSLGAVAFERQHRVGRSSAPGEAVSALCRALPLGPATDTRDVEQVEVIEPAVVPARRRGSSLELRALGSDEVRLDGRTLTAADFGYAKPRELLFFLAETGPADKARIGLALWPEASQTELRSAFHTTLHHLRRAVGADRVVFAAGAYRLVEDGMTYDVARFRETLDRARAARPLAPAPDPSMPDPSIPGTSPVAPQRSFEAGSELCLLLEALALYTGDLLPTVGAGWADRLRDELRSTQHRAMLAAARLTRRAGRTADAVALYERLVRLDPLAEVAHRELMLCLDEEGDRGRALRQYEALRTILHDQLGVLPDPRTLAARDRLLSRTA